MTTARPGIYEVTLSQSTLRFLCLCGWPAVRVQVDEWGHIIDGWCMEHFPPPLERLRR
jgi:hypothetical protein